MSRARLPAIGFEPGTVWLVGAGPGDPGLLTLHALSAIEQADIIVYDALVSPAVLALAGPGTRLESAGKRGGRPSPSQHDISLRLIALAREGRRVLRLKGGDPFVFGRGAEEAGALAAAGIRFRVVPGITAGIGGLAYAGIAATSRETNQAVILVAGHPADGEPDTVDWAALARTGQPLVIYMGLGRLARIAQHLIEGGLAPDTPLAVAARLTLPEQLVIEGTLEEAAAIAARMPTTAPSLVVIGSILRLRRLLAATTGASA